MYFFVGRSSRWDAYIGIFNVSGTFQVGETVSGGGWSGVVAAVYPNSLLLNTILPTPTTTPAFGTTLTGGTSSATAKSGVYRYGTEDAPPAPLDNRSEKRAIYERVNRCQENHFAFCSCRCSHTTGALHWVQSLTCIVQTTLLLLVAVVLLAYRLH